MARLAESALVKLDRSLLSALVDRWRPETHTFHLPCGEMAPTLQDVAMLLGLSITGDAVGPRVVPSTWLEDLEERFAGVATTIDPEDFNEHPQSKGPSKSWLLQFQVQFRTKRCVDIFYGFEITHVFLILNVRTSLQPDLLAAHADDYSVTRSLEAYLLWLFGYIMFNNSHGHCVDRVLLPYAQEIADQTPDVLSSHNLHVEVHDGGGLVKQQGMVQIRWAAGIAGILLDVVLIVRRGKRWHAHAQRTLGHRASV